jgi:(1->4)-alpha-D-glucan 1-alpha-D-glucosylmutase
VAELRATYRLQLGPGMGFAQARALVPYLRDLGVSHLYLPPSFQARTGSTHGYDVVDPRSISEELGGRAEFDALVAAVHEAGMGIVLDIVPNHMATDERNRYWTDPALREQFFDIDPETGRHRRFFDIDDLAGVRQEDPEVFAETHALALELVRDGAVDGLRIDHPDGLADPAEYLRRLRDGGAEHVWVEKILDAGETLRDWPVEGTVGYEFLNDVAGLWIDPAGEAPLTALWHEIAGDERPFGAWADAAKLEQARGPFAVDAERLAREWPGVEGVEEALASLPVYRTYIVDEPGPQDREILAEAGLTEWIAGAPRAFVTRFQQTTPPVMAKGVEDTAFYRYARLLALNDVGGDPSRFGLSIDGFHAANAERARRFPRNLLVTQTHDTKRSGDVRARIGAIASMPAEWEAHVRRWLEATSTLEGPDDIERYFLFQTLAGVWPIDAERLEGYVEKALREAKRTTNWIDPDEAHEAAVRRFLVTLLEHRPFLADFEPFAAELARAGDRAALGQLLFKLTVPGIADVYQGDELLALSLVDPDNRRAVDWDHRRGLLDALRAGAEPTDETRKLWLIWRALELRARRPDAFAGAYEPLDAGPEVCAFVRGGEVVAAAAIRGDGVGATIPLPAGRWRSVLDGADADAEAAIGPHGIALLERAAAD